MDKQITSIRYNAGKLESTKRILTFTFLLAVMIYSFIKGNLQWNKDSFFIIAFFGFSAFILTVSIAGYNKERIRTLSTSNWKYRLYKKTNDVAYLIIRGVITAFLFTALFTALLIRKNGLEAILQKGDLFLYSFPILTLVAGLYHMVIIKYIFRNGTPVFNNVE